MKSTLGLQIKEELLYLPNKKSATFSYKILIQKNWWIS